MTSEGEEEWRGREIGREIEKEIRERDRDVGED
jgi:hypothetical protein